MAIIRLFTIYEIQRLLHHRSGTDCQWENVTGNEFPEKNRFAVGVRKFEIIEWFVRSDSNVVYCRNEKDGIPANLLSVLDVAVEIPQLGVVRSLNVHVSGALFVWEYARQHHFTS